MVPGSNESYTDMTLSVLDMPKRAFGRGGYEGFRSYVQADCLGKVTHR